VRGIVQHQGGGEPLFGGRIVLRSTLPELCLTESFFPDARPGAEPHLHHYHSDSFYVLEGELAFLLHDKEHVLGPGACVCAPPGVVHGFRSLSAARFLNFHTPDGGFAESLRARNRGEPGGFDSVDVEPGSGLPPTDAILLRAGEGEALRTRHRVATVQIGRDELALIEFELEPTFEGPGVHAHDDHTDAFYVLSGDVGFTVDGESFVAGPGAFVAATTGVEHSFTSGLGGGRLLNIHAPSTGFHERLREMTAAAS
jgi:quercetin dioxygenase-like cupin family protein